MKEGKRWRLAAVVAVMTGMLVLLGCPSAGAGGGGNGGGNNGDEDGTSAENPAVGVEVLLNGAVLDGASPVDFGDVVLGGSRTLRFLIRNVGTERVALSESSFSLTGANSGEFAVDRANTAATLAADEETEVAVTFSPTGAIGGRTAAITVTVSAEADGISVELTGNGVIAAVANLELLYDGSVLDGQTAITYGEVPYGDSVGRTFTLRNSGNGAATLTGDKVTLGGTYPEQYSTELSSLPDTIDAGANATFTVLFSPTGKEDPGPVTATMTIQSDAATGPPTIDLTAKDILGPRIEVAMEEADDSSSKQPLSDDGSYPETGAVTVRNEQDSFPPTDLTLTISNNGDRALSITALELTGDGKEEFQFDLNASLDPRFPMGPP